jgi:hypothetical protein
MRITINPLRRARRRGAMTFTVLLAFATFLLVLLVSVQQMTLRGHRKVELQNTVDDVAHAGAIRLNDELIHTDPADDAQNPRRDRILTAARANALQFAALNRVGGSALTLTPNPNNYTDGDLVFGTLTSPIAAEFDANAKQGIDLSNPDLNAVHVQVRSNRAAAKATAYLDRDVVGFRFWAPPTNPPATPYLPVPLVPIALFSDPCPPADNALDCWSTRTPSSWEYQILARKGADAYRLDAKGVPVQVPANNPPADGLREITIVISQDPGTTDSGRLVSFNPKPDPNDSLADVLRQVAGGVAYNDLPAAAGGQMLLNDGTGTKNELLLSRQPLPNDKKQVSQLATALTGILGQPRIWMLYWLAQSDNPPPGAQTVPVVGFVVARVMAVDASNPAQVSFVLQPSVLVSDAAVTNFQLRGLGPRSLYNPYLARVRIVE